MLIRLKNIMTFETIATFNTDEFTISEGEGGTVFIRSLEENILSVSKFINTWALLDDEIYFAESASYENEKIKITFGRPIMFMCSFPQYFGYSGQVLEPSSLFDTYGNIFKRLITYYTPAPGTVDNYRTCGAPQYIECENLCGVPFDDEVQLVKGTGFANRDSMKKFIEGAISRGVEFDFSITGNTLKMTVKEKPINPVIDQIVIDNVNNILINEEYQNDTVSTVRGFYLKKGMIGSHVEAVWKLGTDGKFHTERFLSDLISIGGGYSYIWSDSKDVWVDAHKGATEAVEISFDDARTYEEQQEALQEVADRNKFSYSIEFTTKKKLVKGQMIRIKRYDSVLDFEVSSVTKDSKSDIYTVLCGNLVKTVKDKLNGTISNGILYL